MSVSLKDIQDAARRIAAYIHRTPVARSRTINELTGAELYFKCENFQKAGAFKMRGASNAVAQLDREQAARGVATHSSGNHGAALALAARGLGIRALIVVPDNASAVKKRAVAAYGGEVVLCAPTLAARESTLAEVVGRTGAIEIHSYNDERIIAGQGTATLELIADAPELDVIMAPVGGGGLISGTAIAAKGLRPRIEVIGAEPEGADDALRSLASGTIQPSTPNTICDGLLTQLGDRTFPVIREHVSRIVTASDAEVVAAMRLVWERMKIIVEPSSVVTLAAILSGKLDVRGRRVGIILSGGNIDIDNLPFSRFRPNPQS